MYYKSCCATAIVKLSLWVCAGYVGYFCLAAGVNLACNVEVLSMWLCPLPSAHTFAFTACILTTSISLSYAVCRQGSQLHPGRIWPHLLPVADQHLPELEEHCECRRPDQACSSSRRHTGAAADAQARPQPSRAACCARVHTGAPVACPTGFIHCWPAYAGIVQRPLFWSWRLMSRHVIAILQPHLQALYLR